MTTDAKRKLVRPAGLEPATPGLGNRCSILLSYGRATVILLEILRELKAD